MSTDLNDFVRRALEAKIARPEIARTLAAAGWLEADIKSALGAFADVPFALAVPRPRPSLSARDVFTYLVMFGALYASVWYVLSLLFSVIDKLVPDPANANGAYLSETIRWSIAWLVVSFPLFLWMFVIANRRLLADPAARNSWPRKWLTYLTLALSTCALACDLASIVYSALGGELTLRLILKTLAVAVVAGGTFLYFFNDVRQGEEA